MLSEYKFKKKQNKKNNKKIDIIISFECFERNGMIKLFGTSRSDEGLAKADWNKHAYKHITVLWSTQSKTEGRRSNEEQLG